MPTNLPPDLETTSIDLALLATSDLHGHVLSYDYYSDMEASKPALSRIASAVGHFRAKSDNTLLVDNGDFLQGSPLSDLFSDLSPPAGLIHPVISAMNSLNYDAVGLGNHEFNLPLPRLSEVLAKAEFPLLCANLKATDFTPRRVAALWQPHIILNRCFNDRAGRRHTLKIGLFATAPPQVMDWDHSRVEGKLAASDSVEAARVSIAQLRAHGADIVVALAHTGLSTAPARPLMENTGLQIAALRGLDALVLGHTHLEFPGPHQPAHDSIDVARGTICGVPCIQPAAMAASLGVLNLTLTLRRGEWSVTDHRPTLVPVSREPEDRGLLNELTPTHNWALAELRKPVGQLSHHIHSYLGVLPDCPAVRLVGEAQGEYVQEKLSGTFWDGVPVLSAASPQRCGGRGGPRHYTDFGPGDVAVRDVSALQYFPNDVSALRLTGAEIADWLERSASLYTQILPGMPDQPLTIPDFPVYNSDTVFGLTYEIDLTEAPRFGPNGAELNPNSNRIRNLCWQRRPINPDQVFVLAVNNYRASGGAAFPHASPERIIFQEDTKIRDLLMHKISQREHQSFTAPSPWRFIPVPETSVLFETGPGFSPHYNPTRHPALTKIGKTDTGFLRLQIDLSL